MAKELKVRFQQRIDESTKWAAVDPVLLTGEIGIESDTKKFKFGDGTTKWSELDYAGIDQTQLDAIQDGYHELTPNAETSDNDALATIEDPIKGDITVIKRVISSDGVGSAMTHTAYVYNGTNWAAMEGNYDASNVYFSDDLMITYNIGNITLTNGQATVSAKDKNLLDVWNSMWVKETNTDLKKTTPSASINGITADNYLLIGATSTAQTATVSLNNGSYDYGYGFVDSKNETVTAGTDAKTVITSGTGAEVDTYTFKIDGVAQTSSSAANTFAVPAVTKNEIAEHKITATINYKNCGHPVSNLKKIYPAQKYADATTAEVNKTVNRWYIPFYQGFTYSDGVINTTNITANDITTKLQAPVEKTADNKVTSTTTSVKITGKNAYDKLKCTAAVASKAWRQYFIAYPKAWEFDMSAAKDSNGIDCTVNGPVEVTIAHNGIDVVYNVYYINNAADYGTLGITWTIS